MYRDYLRRLIYDASANDGHKNTASLNNEKAGNDNGISEGKEGTKAENSRSNYTKDDSVNTADPPTVKAESNPTGETIKIPLTRGQITSDMVMRGNKIDSLTDFKVLITLEMSGKMQKENAAMSKRAYGGDLSMTYPSSAKIVRIFTSSTFTDTKHERNTWMERAYPRLKRHCQSRGYEFQVVDMRWGVRDEATDDHRGTELCLRELELCQKLSTGPNFISLLSHKYGYTSLPREIDAEEFSNILHGTNKKTDKDLLEKWYKRDDNSLPPVFLLQTISALLPDYMSHDQEKKKSAKTVWWTESEALQKILSETALKVLGEKEAMKYIISKVQKGIQGSKDPGTECLWFRREIPGIQDVESSWQLSRYIECLGPEEKWQHSRRLLGELKQDMSNVLPPGNVHEYLVPWTEKGVDPSFPDHAKYLQQMNDDFEQEMTQRINAAITERETVSVQDPLLQECVQHLEFCQAKFQAYGRSDDLQKIRTYLEGPSRIPFVVHATSGSGKTTVLAMAASQTKSWLSENTSVIIRFVGTTSGCTDLVPFLQNLTQQIKKAKGQYSYQIEGDVKRLISEFHASLEGVQKGSPVVLYIDALDQFSAARGARELNWLPRLLPENVKVVVSTVEEPQYECFRKLKSFIKEESNFLHVKPFTKDDVQSILSKWLETDRRTLTNEQRHVLTAAVHACPLALFLRLSYDSALSWESYRTGHDLQLEHTVRASINELFRRLEVMHGRILTSRAFGYITASINGLSEAELEDILSCDDDVLNDVYMYWTPPIRRLPPLLLVRLKASLEDKHYIVKRGVDDVLVLYWYHRQFSEAASERYCPPSLRATLHTGLADFFSGVWAQGNKKPYSDRQGNSDAMDRHVADQQYKIGERYNARKLNNLAYHRIMSEDVGRSKEDCLCNFQFILHRIKGTSVRQLLDDFDLACDAFPTDESITNISQALRLSETGLSYDADTLVSQMLGRLPRNEFTATFLDQCKGANIPHLETSRRVLLQTGGQLEYCLHGDDEEVWFLDMTQDGVMIVTSAKSDIVKLWDVRKGKLVRSVENIAVKVKNVNFVNGDTGILVRASQSLVCLSILGDVNYTIPLVQHSLYAIGGRRKSTLCVYKDDWLQFYDLTTAEKTHLIKMEGAVLTDPRGYNEHQGTYRLNLNYGTDVLMALVDNTSKSFVLLNLKSMISPSCCHVFDDVGEEEELEIDAIAVTNDNRYVIVASMLTNDLHIFDANTLKKNHVINGIKTDYSEKFQMSSDGQHLYFPSREHIVLYNLETRERKAILRHNHDVAAVRSADMTRYVTVNGDNGICIWNTANKEVTAHREGFIGTSVSRLMKLPNSYYVVTLTTHRQDYYIQVHDVQNKIKVRQTKLFNDHENGSGLRPRIIDLVTPDTILMVTNSRRLKNISLETMKTTLVYQGRTVKYPPVAVINKHREIATCTRGRCHIKVQCTETGVTKCLIRVPAGVSGTIEDIKTGSSGGILAVILNRSSDVLLIDVTNRSLRYVINILSDLQFLSESIFDVKISSEDRFILFTDRKTPKGYHPKSKTDFITVLFDIDSRKSVELFDRHKDVENFILYGESKMSVYDAEILDNNQIVTSHDDGALRVWDSETGDQLKTLCGHTTSTELSSCPGNPYFVSNAAMDKEESFRVWEKASLRCLASFKLDSYQSKLVCLDGNRGFVTCEANPARVIHWTLEGYVQEPVQKESHVVLFKGQILNLSTHLIEEEDFYDDDHLDEDEMEKSDDEDEDENENEI